MIIRISNYYKEIGVLILIIENQLLTTLKRNVMNL
jgi:hypothetical protein